MCGIWASIGLEASQRVIDAVAHRGPDGSGWRVFDSASGPVTLGHRRLSIFDPGPGGAQPMADSGGTLWITYNGALYNHVELRTELEELGHDFASRSDTEVLLAAYREWGESCLERFNGMFAFVIWDTARQRLFAARDRYGVKPLYFACVHGAICFASEIKQIALVPGFRARLDRQRAYDFLAAGLFDHTDRTLFDGVRQLRGGEKLSIDVVTGLDARPIRWYRLPAVADTGLSLDDSAARFSALLEDAVRIRLRADAEVGSCLSGGLDSSAIVCVSERVRDRRPVLGTVSACFDEPEADEREYMRAVIRQTGGRNYPVSPGPEDVAAVLATVLYHQDEPFASTSIFAQWFVFERAREAGLRVMLDGQGADELLGGYHTMYGAHHAGLLRGLRLLALVSALAAERRRHGTPLRTQLGLLAASALPARASARLFELTGRFSHPAWLRREAWDDCETGLSPFLAAWIEAYGDRPRTLGEMCRACVETTSLPMLLHYEDRNAMAHGIESRLPFLDWRLVEFAIALGSRHKMVEGETKRVLREAMTHILPEAVRTRQSKLGFATPERRWLSGPLASWLNERLERAAVELAPMLDPQALARLRTPAEAANASVAAGWRVVCFAEWVRRFEIAI